MADTIFALASGAGHAGIAVIRISGAGAGVALETLTREPLPTPDWQHIGGCTPRQARATVKKTIKPAHMAANMEMKTATVSSMMD